MPRPSQSWPSETRSSESQPLHTVCVDIGNSGMRCVHLADDDCELPPRQQLSATTVPWTGDVLRVDWMADSQAPAIADTIDRSLTQWLERAIAAGRKPTADAKVRWLVSSVQRTMESHLQTFVRARGAEDYRLVTYQSLELDVQVDQPERVGVDRLLAALAAMKHCPNQSLIVIQAGSAITVDWVQSPNIFSGGAIMPGVPMILRLLSQAADLLPQIAAKELFDLPPLPGKNTTAAMNVGASSAVVGGVQHLVARYRQQYGADALVVLSGGDGPRLIPHLEPPVMVIEQLVLRGLALLAQGM